MLEIYQRRYELTPETESRVAALVTPRVDDDEDEEDGAGEADGAPRGRETERA